MDSFPNFKKRSIRVFISSTFKDMREERDALMSHCWPELRLFCKERQVELVEVDLRWGISVEQSTRKETLKICLDEINACRPFFISLLGERYGWVPEEDALLNRLAEDHPWLKDKGGKSVTELEILYGVLNNPEMAGRAFFYFRDPEYVKGKGDAFLSETLADAEKQTALKALIREICSARNIPLKENYSDPVSLALLVLEQLKTVIGLQFPIEENADPLACEARNHEAFAEIRRRTYIGRPEYFEALEKHVSGTGDGLVLLGDSGSGKSSLLANWADHWRKVYPEDFIFQHYIGGTPDGSIHWRLMSRLMAEIKQWLHDPDELPGTNDEKLRDFPVWLSKAKIYAQQDNRRFIVILDALNQLEDIDHGQLFGWLPINIFTGALRLIVSTIPGDIQDIVENRSWSILRIQPLREDERQKIIIDYLSRYSKKLDPDRLNRISTNPLTANPLFLKTLLDELRVTGIHEELDNLLNDYLNSKDIAALLGNVLVRYQRDYEHDRKGLVSEALGLIWASRRGLTEFELLQLLRPSHLSQLPLAIWAPLHFALEEGLLDRGGVLNFANNFLRTAVEVAFIPDQEKKDEFRLKLADYFETQPISERKCDELPWLLWQTESFVRLRKCILDIDQVWIIKRRDEEELRGYWVSLNEERWMGQTYLENYYSWLSKNSKYESLVETVTNELGNFLKNAALPTQAETLYRQSVKLCEKRYGKNHPNMAFCLNNLAQVLQDTSHYKEAETLIRSAVQIAENSPGNDQRELAIYLNNLAALLTLTNRRPEAEPLLRRALQIDENCYGEDHPKVATCLNNLATLLQEAGKMGEAEPLFRRALQIDENNFGKDHPKVAILLNNLANLLKDTNEFGEAELLIKRALQIQEYRFGKEHPMVANSLNSLASLLNYTNRMREAEPLLWQALQIDENCFGKDHPDVARDLTNLTLLLIKTNRREEAEPLIRRSLRIHENSLGNNHRLVALDLNYLAVILQDTNRREEAEQLMSRALQIDENNDGIDHPTLARDLNNLGQLLKESNRMSEAETVMRKALKINERCFGKDHTLVAVNLNNLAVLYRDTNRIGEAEMLMQRVIEIDKKCLGENHPNLATGLNNLAQLYADTNRIVEAEPLMRRALQIYEKSLGENHPNVSACLNNLAQLLKITGHLDEAEALLRRSIEIVEKSFGENHPDVARGLNNLGQLLKETNRIGEAEPVLRKALQIFEVTLGPTHPNVSTSLSILANVLIELNAVKEAEQMLRRIIQIDEHNLGKDHVKVAISLYNLVLLLKDTNQLVIAEPLMTRALIILIANVGAAHPKVVPLLENYLNLLQAIGWNEDQIAIQMNRIVPEFFN